MLTLRWSLESHSERRQNVERIEREFPQFVRDMAIDASTDSMRRSIRFFSGTMPLAIRETSVIGHNVRLNSRTIECVNTTFYVVRAIL